MTKVEYSVNTTAKQEALERIRQRLWRRSHSLNTCVTFDAAIKRYNEFLNTNNITDADAILKPIETLDKFVNYLDSKAGKAKMGVGAGTTRITISHSKKLLKEMGAKIDSEEFKDKIVMPKRRIFNDDKVTKEQARRLILGTESDRLKCVLMLMKDTQMRDAEALALTVEDFDFKHSPAYVTLQSTTTKNDLPRELFITNETVQMIQSYMQSKFKTSGYVFIHQEIQDEVHLQKVILSTTKTIGDSFRLMLRKPEFADMTGRIGERYKIHIYSFKKFAFTAMADTLGEIAARAIKGDKDYVLTYYKKNREERAADYRKVMPKLLLFSTDEERTSLKKKLSEELKGLNEKDLASVLEFVRTARG